jgi:hypothetical protein
MIDSQRQIELKLSLLEQSLLHLRNQQQLGVALPDLARDIQGLLIQVNAAANWEAELIEV